MYRPVFDTVSTTLFYIFVCFMIVLFAYHGERKKRQKLVIWAYIILCLLTILRFDIGNDYAGYANGIDYIAKKANLGLSPYQLWYYDNFDKEIGYYVFTWMFSWLPNPYVFVIGIYGFVSIYFLYKSLNRYEGYHTLGLLIYIISGIMFNSWDWVRQSVAFMIVLYSLPFIEHRKPFHYALMIILGMLFHKTIILMLPFYFVTYLHINRFVIVGILLITFALYFVSFFQNTLGEIMQYADMADGYEAYARNQQALEQAESLNFKLRCLLYVFFWSSLIIFIPSEEDTKKNLLFIGAIAFLIASGSQALQRISFYFLVACIPAMPCAWHHVKKKKIPILNMAVMSILVVMTGLWVRDIITGNNRGCTPYDSVLFENFANQKFRPKGY